MEQLKRVFTLIATLFVLTLSTAGNANEVRKLYELEEVRVLSQRISKNYFYIHQDIRALTASEEINADIERLNKLVEMLKHENLSKVNENLIVFIEFTVADLVSVVNEPYSELNGALMIDFGESILEGIDAILETEATSLKTNLIAIEDLKFNLERMTKYYISFRGGFDDENNVVQMNSAIEEFDQKLAIVRANPQNSQQYLQALKKVERYWPIAKGFFDTIEESSLPRVVLSSSDYLNNSLDVLLDVELKQQL